LRVSPFQARREVIQGIQVGLGGGGDDIHIGAVAVDDPAAFFQSYRDFTLAISTDRTSVV